MLLGKKEKGFQHNQIDDALERVKKQLDDSTNHIENSDNPIVRKHADIAQTLMTKEPSF